MAEEVGGERASQKLKSWELWSPDPIDAISNTVNDGSNMGSKSNIITMLVSDNYRWDVLGLVGSLKFSFHFLFLV